MPDLGDKVFLSPAMGEITAQLRKNHAKTFSLAERLNELAHQKIFVTEFSGSNGQHVLIACLLQRALTTYQGIVLLSERGMPSEAITLLRTLLEVVFRLVAIAKDPEIGRAYILEDEVHRRKFINKFKLLSEPVRSGLGNPMLDDLLASIRKNISDKDIQELKTQWFAEKAGLADFYHSAYSYFSGTVHVNVRDLESSLEVDGEGNVTGFNYGPREAGVDEVLFTAIESLIICLREAFSALKCAPDSNVDAIHAEFVSLHEEFFLRNQASPSPI